MDKKKRYIAAKTNRKRKQSRIKAIVIILFFILGLIFIYSMAKKKIGPSQEKPIEAVGKEEKKEEEEVDKKIEEEKENLEEEKPVTFNDKLKLIEDYPRFLKEMAERYPETIDFVIKYPERNLDPSKIDISHDYVTGEVPLFIQWDDRWGYMPFIESIVGISGCGPTALSMAYTGLTGDLSMDPYKMSQYAEQNGYGVINEGSTWDLFQKGATDLGLTSEMIYVDNNIFKESLDQGKYIVLNVGPGDFTNGGHFILVVDYNEEGYKVHDSNSLINSAKTWTFDSLMPQIKAAWALGK